MSLGGFEVAIVGAGPAGSAAAITLAREGVQVLLVERGTFPGSKNVFGGRIYSYALKKLLGDSWKDAPVERFVRKEGITFMTSDNAFSVEFESRIDAGTGPNLNGSKGRYRAAEREDRGTSRSGARPGSGPCLYRSLLGRTARRRFPLHKPRQLGARHGCWGRRCFLTEEAILQLHGETPRTPKGAALHQRRKDCRI